MKLTKEEALALYVQLFNAESDDVINDLMCRIKSWLLSDDVDCDITETEDHGHGCEGCAATSDDEEDDLDDEDEEEIEEDDDETEVPEADGSVDPEDLHELVAVMMTTPSGGRSKVEFEEYDDGPVDLVVEATGEIIKNVSHVRRESSSLSVFNDDGWTTFETKKFPKAWTALLAVGTVYAVER